MIAREEIFGGAGGDRVRGSDLAIARGNQLKERQEGASRRAPAPAGALWINNYNIYDTAAAFGGYKQSGFRREMKHARARELTQVKSVWGI